jgi:acyl transferase domain-containing protein/acyl carrier protein
LSSEVLLVRVDVVQPVLWAVMVSLAAVWESFGVRPSAVVGHSQGEIAAAVVAGGLSLEDGARVVALRSKALAGIAGSGGMAAVSLPVAEVEVLIGELSVAAVNGRSSAGDVESLAPGQEASAAVAGDESSLASGALDGPRLWVAAVNGPSSTVVAGDAEAVAALVATEERARLIPVDYASHTVHVEAVRDELLAALGTVEARSGNVPFYSTVTGGLLDTSELDTAYWYRNLREQVRFEDAVQAAGHGIHVEVSPHPVLGLALPESVGTLRRDDGGWDRVLGSVADAYVRGAHVDWSSAVAGGQLVDLPTYAFEHERYWLRTTRAGDLTAAGIGAAGHPLLGAAVDLADDRLVLTGRIDPDGWLTDHVVHGTPILPGTALLDLALHAGQVIGYERVEELTMHTPLALNGTTRIQVVVEPPTEHGRAVTIHAATGEGWTKHASGTLTEAHPTVPHPAETHRPAVHPAEARPDLTQWPPDAVEIDPTDLHDRFATAGFDYGPHFHGLRRVWRDATHLFAEVVLPTTSQHGFTLHPALLDAALHPLGVTDITTGSVPFAWSGVTRFAGADAVRVRLTRTAEDTFAINIADMDGNPVLTVDALTVRPLPSTGALFHLQWDTRPATPMPDDVDVIDGTSVHDVLPALQAPRDRHLVIRTRNAVAVTPGEDVDPDAAAVWGLVRAAQTEQPGRFTLVDGDLTSGDEPQVAVRGDTAYVPRLARTTGTARRVAGTVLITGGTGTLGRLVARHLLNVHQVDKVVLASRNPQPVEGAQVVACDVSDRAAVAALLKGIENLTGVIHLAGVLADGILESQTPQRLRTVFAPKADAARHLHDLTGDLDFFVLFSSVSGILGGAGQANYAAANAYLDGLAQHRHAHGQPAVSLAWGLWEERSALTAGVGGAGLSTKDALALLDEALGSSEAVLIPMRPTNRRAVAQVRTRTAADPGDLVRVQVAAVLGLSGPDAVEPGRPFREMGFDSLLAVELRNRLVDATGRKLPVTVVFDHPTPDALAALLRNDQPARPVETKAIVGDPVVIVGMGCRYPGGVTSPEELWQLVADGVDAVSAFPDDRGWGVVESVTQQGGFLHDAAHFDADFFGISPREARAMDPQHRLLLETSWDALERAGINPLGLRGSQTGVFAGVMHHDYHLNGSTGSLASGRIAYAFGLAGPALTVDTACSSSLVALHLAAQSLRSGECTLALAGGVTVMAGPELFVEFTKQGGLSADGRCRSFADDADGTGWSEGVGVLVLERLSDAERNGHPVLAVVRGTATNSDGRSNGLTAPNGPAQERVIRQALANAGLSTSDIEVVEGHGTGTVLGDPIEAQALLATYGRDRDRPLWLGSLKSNIGHAQAAAGVAGLIKMVQAMRHGVLPRTLHADTPSSKVDWAGVRLLTEAVPWDGPRRAAVSSFGLSGTNAHVIIEQPTVRPPADGVEAVLAFPISARTDNALRDLARQLATHPGRTVDIARTLATRTRFDRRAVVVGTEWGPVDIGPQTGTGLAFVFPGQGAQRLHMGQELYQRFGAYAEAFDAVDALLPVKAALADEELLHQTRYAQAALFAVEVALFRLMEAFGVRPDHLVGHSIGEVAAAHVSGVLSLADACALVAARGRLMQELPEGGAMVAVNLPSQDIHLPSGVAIAAVNGPSSTVVSGDTEPVLALADQWAARGVRVRRLRVSHAFHSHRMDDMLGRFAAELAGISFATPEIPIVSTATGRIDDMGTVGYWVRQVRVPVRFADAVATIADTGLFLELGPAGGLAATVPGRSTAVLPKDKPEVESLLRAVGAAFVGGAPVRWDAQFEGMDARVIDLPTYPFERRRYWTTEGSGGESLRYRIRWEPIAELRDVAGTTTVGGGGGRGVRSERIDESRDVVGSAIVGGGGVRGEWIDESRDVVGSATAGGGGGRGVRGHRIVGPWDLVGGPAAGHSEAVADLVVVGPADHPWAAAFVADGVPVVESLTDERPSAVLSILDLPGTLQLLRADLDCPLWLAGSGAVAGLGRVFGLEHPDRRVGLVSLPDIPDVPRVRRAIAGEEDDLWVHDKGVSARRLVRSTEPPRRSWQPRGTVLVTGGSGSLGTHVTRWLLDQGAERVVLASRSGTVHVDSDRVTGVACDVADRDAVARMLAGIDDLTAVIHAAGMAETCPVADLSAADLDVQTRAKFLGAVNLDALTGPLDAFVLFSSVAGVWGSAGQGAYAAANAHLDDLAVSRKARGLTATAIAWGPWTTGMGSGGEELRRRGLRPMTPDVALAQLRWAVNTDEPAVVVADVDWERFGPLYTAARPRPLISALYQPPRAEPTGDVSVDLVLAQVAAVLGHEEIDPDRSFHELGFDSVTAVEFRDRLATALGRDLPPTMVFDHPTPEALTAWLAGAKKAERTTGQASDEPIAIVAMSCRYPGGIATPEQLWDFVAAAKDAVGPFPTDRGWDVVYDPDPDKPGRTYVREGGFLDGAGDFDAGFFGIGPNEALAMDPQQRVLLETTWEALERAGLDMAGLRGSRTGVFVGGGYQDYAGSVAAGDLEGHLLTGNATSVVSGRLAYTFGLEGPAITVDTACSSSLVAVHLAAQSLRSGECSMAIAAGVTVMAAPDAFVMFSRQRALAADGRCKPFAAAADGTNWAEGAGVLVLERLSDARRNGHRVLAVVRGSAVNSDGASNGLTAPNGPAQERVIRAALANAGLRPSDVDAVEAHGTGTALGDPIEARALAATYGADRDRPLWLGSVKSNIGHTQAASGVAGVIKMVHAIRHGLLPKTLHVDAPTPHADWTTLRLLTEPVTWPNGPRRAGVSSFGVSGTNAHVIIEQPPTRDPDPSTAGNEVSPSPENGVVDWKPGGEGHPVVWPLSARDPQALRQQAEQLAELRERPLDIGHTLATTRRTFEYRAAVVGARTEDLAAALANVTPTKATPGRIVFLFPGQGTQWPGMAVDLLAEPVFARRMAECATALAPYVDWDPRDVLDEPLTRVDVIQPVLFSIMVSLADLWRSWGVRPDAVIGHSQGEIAAACVAGVLSLPDAARVVALRSRALAHLAGAGGMVAVALSAVDTAKVVAELSVDGRTSASDGVTGRDGTVALSAADSAKLVPDVSVAASTLAVAASNGPTSTVVSGPPEALDAFVARCEADGVRVRRIDVDYASHSAQVDAVRDRLLTDLATVRPRPGDVPVYSTVTGQLIPGEDMDAEYWFRNLRDTVLFADTVAAALTDNHRCLIEVSPHPVLTIGTQEVIDDLALDATVVGTLRRGEGRAAMLAALGEVYTAGVDPEWTAVLRGGRVVDLPTYPFQRRRYWLTKQRHPFLQSVVDLADGRKVFSGTVVGQSWLADHVVDGTVTLPGTALLEMAAHVGRHIGLPRVGELVLETPVTDVRDLQVTVDASGRFTIHARAGDEWTRHASGSLAAAAGPNSLEWTEAEPVDTTGVYERLDEIGLHYGPAFQGLRRAWRQGDVLFAEVHLDNGPGFAVHPALLDAALHALALRENGPKALPFAFTGVELRPTNSTVLRVRLDPSGAIAATDDTGQLVFAADAVHLRPTGGVDNLYQQHWVPAGPTREPTHPVTTRWVTERDITDAVTEAVTWVREALDTESRLVVVTRGAVHTDIPDPAGAAVWGLVRSAQAEHPDTFFLVDTDHEVPAVDEPQVSVRDGEVYVPKLRRAAVGQRGPWQPTGTVLVTGGTGMVGSAIARRLVERGATKVVLVSRSGTPVDVPNAVVVAADVADRDAMAKVLAEHPVDAVVHAAGVLDDHLVTDLDRERVERVLKPKVDGALILAELVPDIEAFVLCSAAAGVLGSPGQGNYAAANAALDALACRWRAQGIPAVSLAWGLWETPSGMTGHLSEAHVARTRASGVAPLSTEDALALFEAALATDEPVLVPIRLEPPEPPKPTEVHEPRDALDLVRQHAAAVLGHVSSTAIPASRGFTELGFDSLFAVRLRTRLADATGLRLPATVVFDHPTPRALADHLTTLLAPAEDELTRLVAEITELAGDQRDAVTERLRVLLASMTGGTEHQDIAEASDDDLFDILDNEL